MKRTLLNINDDLLALDDLLAECGGDISDPRVAEAIDAWMAELDADLDSKVDGYCTYIRELEGRSEVRKSEADRLATRAHIDKNNARFLKERLKAVLQQRGMKKMETERFRVSVAGNGGRRTIEFTGEVPEDFTKTVTQTDHEKIREALDAGERLPFAHLRERGTHLTIR